MNVTDLEVFIAAERAAAIAWARGLVGRTDWVVLDTETTGLGPDAEAVQVAVLSPSGRTLLDALVRPTVPIPPDATAVHGIDDQAVALAVTYPDVHAALAGLIAVRTVVAFNASYDRRVLERTAGRYGYTLPGGTWECSMERYAAFAGDWDEGHGSFRYQRLPRPVPSAGRHSARSDCRATLVLIQRMAVADAG